MKYYKYCCSHQTFIVKMELNGMFTEEFSALLILVTLEITNFQL